MFSTISNLWDKIFSKNPRDFESIIQLNSNNITATTALDNTIFYKAVEFKAATISQIQPKVMFRTSNGLVEPPLADGNTANYAEEINKLLLKPNESQTSYDFHSQITFYLETFGDCFIHKKKNVHGKVIALYLMDPTDIKVTPLKTGYTQYKKQGVVKPFNHSDIIHIKKVDYFGYKSLSPIKAISSTIALNNYIESLTSYIMRNSVKISGIFSTDQTKTPKEIEDFEKEIERFKGTDSKDKSGVLLLQGGFKYNKIDIPKASDADLDQLYRCTSAIIAASVGVPPSSVGLDTNKTFNGVGAAKASYYADSISPMIKNIKSKLELSLLKDYPDLVIHYDESEFLKGDNLAQMQYLTRLASTTMTPNETREYLGLHRIENPEYDKIQLKPITDSIRGGEPGDSPQDTGGGGNTNPSVGV